jgi:predicted peroxiredoxin
MSGEKILYVQTSGIDAPERHYSPLVLAQTAKAMDMDPALYFLGMGLTVLRKGEAEKIQLGTFPSLKEVMDQTLKAGITFYVCEASKQMLGWDETNLIEEAKVVGAATLNDLVLEYDAVMWF